MDDLISRKALLEDIKAAAGNDFMGTMGACTLTRFVKKQPAVDAEPVVYARWDRSEGNLTHVKNAHAVDGMGRNGLSFIISAPTAEPR